MAKVVRSINKINEMIDDYEIDNKYRITLVSNYTTDVL